MAATENGKLMCERFAHCLINRGECLEEPSQNKFIVYERSKWGRTRANVVIAREGKKARAASSDVFLLALSFAQVVDLSWTDNREHITPTDKSKQRRRHVVSARQTSSVSGAQKAFVIP